MKTDSDFYKLLTPERSGERHFRGASLPLDSPAIFGGQLMAQALSAAAATVDEPRPVHHLQTNFVAFGDPRAPLDFEVTNVRDGKSTSHRHVVLSQAEQPLLTASLSFQKALEGYDHQMAMPDVRPPEGVSQDSDNEVSFSDSEESQFPFKILNCPISPGDLQPVSAVWAKPRMQVPAGELLHQQLFTFFSDVTILQSALAPHKLDWDAPGLTVATMNHSIWFHRPLDINDWVLFYSESPSTVAGRALSVANAFDRSGVLVATVAQEGILRQDSAAN